MGYLLIKAGSGSDNDIVIADPSVSVEHLEIFVDVEGNVFLTDLQSKSGTRVNGVTITDSVELKPFDKVTIGNGLTFDWKKYVDRDTRNTISVGRAESNDVVINSPHVSENHLQLFRDTNGNIFITDLDSAYGTFINGLKLNGIALLEPKDNVKVGKEIFRWRELFPDLKDVQQPVPPRPAAEALRPAPQSEALDVPKQPWYKEHKDLIIIYGLNLLLLLLISWKLK